MATGTNAIATEKEAHDKVHKTTGYTYTENKACTKKLAKYYGAYGLDNYTEYQLVKYSDLWMTCSDTIYENMPLIAVFKDDYYCSLDSYYLLVTVTISDGYNSYTKETIVPSINQGSSNLVSLPSGYIGIATLAVGSHTDSHAFATVAPNGSVEYPCGEGAPDKVTTTITVALYTTGQPGDSTQIMSSDYGSGGGVLLARSGICDNWVLSGNYTWSYDHTLTYVTSGTFYDYWFPEDSKECLVCYDSSYTKSALQNLIF